MRYGILICTLTAAFLYASASEAGGPIRVSSGHPLFLATGNPVLQSAAVEDSIGVYFSYSSIFLLDWSEHWSAVVDAEVAVMEIELRKRPGSATEVSLALPLLS